MAVHYFFFISSKYFSNLPPPVILNIHSGPERVKIKWSKTVKNCQKRPKNTHFGQFLAISAKNTASTPGRTRYTLEVLVRAHRLRYVTHLRA